MPGERDLLDLVGASRAAGRFARRLDRGQQEGHEDPDDRNDDQQFDERKTATLSAASATSSNLFPHSDSTATHADANHLRHASTANLTIDELSENAKPRTATNVNTMACGSGTAMNRNSLGASTVLLIRASSISASDQSATLLLNMPRPMVQLSRIRDKHVARWAGEVARNRVQQLVGRVLLGDIQGRVGRVDRHGNVIPRDWHAPSRRNPESERRC